MRAVVKVGALGVALTLLLGGCGVGKSIQQKVDAINRSNSATDQLQSFIKDQLTSKFHRQVRSVSCSPDVDQVVTDSSASMSCLVTFTDGTSYTAAGTVTDPSNDPDYGYYTFSFTDPPGVDITTAPLPSATIPLSAASSGSLFTAANLAPMVTKLVARFGSHALVLQLALYPGELIAVVADNTGDAWPVSMAYTGALTVGSKTEFSGSRSGIEFSQLVPAVIQRLTEQVVAKGHVQLAGIGRFVLTNSLPDQNSGWNIYLTSGTTRFQALVLGDGLTEITAGGSRKLS